MSLLDSRVVDRSQLSAGEQLFVDLVEGSPRPFATPEIIPALNDPQGEQLSLTQGPATPAELLPQPALGAGAVLATPATA